MHARAHIALLLVLAVTPLGALACGSRTVGADWGCPGPELLTTPLVAANAVLANGTCTLEEEQAGRQHRILCDTQTCRWFVDGDMICECRQLDFVNTCANGIPTCADWRGSIDFASP